MIATDLRGSFNIDPLHAAQVRFRYGKNILYLGKGSDQISGLYRPRPGAHVVTILTQLIAQCSLSNLPIRLINAGIPAPLTEDISRYSFSILVQSV